MYRAYFHSVWYYLLRFAWGFQFSAQLLLIHCTSIFTLPVSALRMFKRWSRVIARYKVLIKHAWWDRLRFRVMSCSKAISKSCHSEHVYERLQLLIMHCWPNFDLSNELFILFLGNLIAHLGRVLCQTMIVCVQHLYLAAISRNMPTRRVYEIVSYRDSI